MPSHRRPLITAHLLLSLLGCVLVRSASPTAERSTATNPTTSDVYRREVRDAAPLAASAGP